MDVAEKSFTKKATKFYVNFTSGAAKSKRKTFLDFQFINGLDNDDEGILKVIFLLTLEALFSEYVMRFF